MIIEKKKIKDLKPAGYNPRKISKAELEKLKNSINKFGYVEPVVWNKQTGTIVGGHQRLTAMDLGPEEEIEVVVVDLNESQEKALNLALNKISGEWESNKLKELLENLQKNDQDILKYTGFDNDEILRMLNQKPKENFDIEKAIRNPKYKVQRGEIYNLGNHRLMCGDSTSKEDIARLMKGERADMVFTDPPYNLNFSGTTDKFEGMANDKISAEEFDKFLRSVFTNLTNYTKREAGWYVCIDYRNYPAIVAGLKDQNLEILNCIVWDKVFAGLGYKYRFRHEFIVFAGDRKRMNWYGLTTTEDIIQIEAGEGSSKYCLDHLGYYLKLPSGEFLQIRKIKEKAKRIPIIEIGDFKEFYVQNDAQDNLMQSYSMNNFGQRDKELTEGIQHPTMKPIKLIENFMLNSSQEGELVLDVFGGSGSTLITAETTRRRCNIIEIDPIYCSLILERWESMTGQMAVKE